MLYLLELFYRLETWIKDTCDEYEPNLVSRVAVFFVYVPMFLYFGLSVMAFTNRKLHHVILSLGLWVADSIIWIASFFIGEVASPAKHCGHRVSLRPAEEAAIVWYIFVFQLIHFTKHELYQSGINDKIRVALQVWCLFVIAVMCTLAQYYLGLFDWFELGIGTVVGVCAAIYWALVAFTAFENEARKKTVAGLLRAKDLKSM